MQQQTEASLFKSLSIAITALILSVFVSSEQAASQTVEIEKTVDDEWFIINGEKFQAKTYCVDAEEGDKVVFIEGSANGVCVSAKFVNLRTNQTCEVWCE